MTTWCWRRPRSVPASNPRPRSREKKIAQLQRIHRSDSPPAHASSQVTSRKKEVERLQSGELAKSNIARPFIRFDMKRPSGRHPLEIRGISKSYGDKSVIKDFTASVSRGEKIGLLGRNGVGKTTLLRSLIANAPGAQSTSRSAIDGGSVEWGHEVAVGFFAQDHRATIQPGLTVLDWLQTYDPTAGTEELRDFGPNALHAR